MEEEVYAVSLWWECRPVLRRNRREEASRQSSEVRGEGASRAEQRVAEERVSVRLETLNSSDEGTSEQGVGSGRAKANQDLSPTTRIWASIGKSLHGSHTLSPIAGPKETRRVAGLGLARGSMGLKMKEVVVSEVGLEAGPSYRAEDVGCLAKGPVSPKDQSSSKGPTYSKGCLKQLDLDGKPREGPISLVAQAPNNDLQEKGSLLKCFISSNGNPPETKPFVARETEDMRKQQGVARLSETDRALEEESLRYGTGSCS